MRPTLERERRAHVRRAGGMAIALSILAAALGLVVQPAEATFPAGENGRIAFNSAANTLTTVRQDGTHPVVLEGPSGASLSDPAYSPDGARIAFAADAQQIWTMSSDGTDLEKRVQCSNACDSVSWTPDGNTLFYEDGTDIFRVQLDPAGTPVNVTSTPDIDEDSPEVSPDGTRVVFTVPSGGADDGSSYCPSASLQGIWTMATDGSDRDHVVPFDATGCYTRYVHPSWSPDSGQIVFLDGGLLHVGTVDADGSDRVDRGPAAGLTQPVFSPTGAELAYECVDDTLCIQALGSGQVNQFPVDGHLGTGLSWAPFVAEPGISVSPATLDFGSQHVGTKGDTQDVVVTNTGNVELAVQAGLASGSDGFALAGTDCGILDPDETCSVGVFFQPASAGPANGVLRVVDSESGTPGPGDPGYVTLMGVGVGTPETSVTPTSVDFGDQRVGTTSAPAQVTVTNTGNGDLHVTAVGASSADFSVENETCTSAAVAPSGSCSIDLAFTPSAAGAVSGVVSITSDAGSSPDEVSVSGRGVEPALTVDTDSVDFGEQLVTTSSATRTITVSSSGSAPLAVTDVSVTGTDDSAFDLTDDQCTGTTVAVGDTCTISVSFTPATAGAHAAAVTITSDAPSAPDSVALSGDGQTPRGAIEDLIEHVRSLGLKKGREKSLVVKLSAALDDLDDDDVAGACDDLGDFVNEVEAQAGKAISDEDADELVDRAETIKVVLGCPDDHAEPDADTSSSSGLTNGLLGRSG